MAIQEALGFGKTLSKALTTGGGGIGRIAAHASIGAAIGGGLGLIRTARDDGEGFGRNVVGGAIKGGIAGGIVGGVSNLVGYKRGNIIKNPNAGKVADEAAQMQRVANRNVMDGLREAGRTARSFASTTPA